MGQVRPSFYHHRLFSSLTPASLRAFIPRCLPSGKQSCLLRSLTTLLTIFPEFFVGQDGALNAVLLGCNPDLILTYPRPSYGLLCTFSTFPPGPTPHCSRPRLVLPSQGLSSLSVLSCLSTNITSAPLTEVDATTTTLYLDSKFSLKQKCTSTKGTCPTPFSFSVD